MGGRALPGVKQTLRIIDDDLDWLHLVVQAVYNAIESYLRIEEFNRNEAQLIPKSPAPDKWWVGISIKWSGSGASDRQSTSGRTKIGLSCRERSEKSRSIDEHLG